LFGDGRRQPEVGCGSGNQMDGGACSVQATLDRGANIARRRDGPQKDQRCIEKIRYRFSLLYAVKTFHNFKPQIPSSHIHVRDYLNWIHDIQDKTPCIALTLFKHENGRVE